MTGGSLTPGLKTPIAGYVVRLTTTSLVMKVGRARGCRDRCAGKGLPEADLFSRVGNAVLDIKNVKLGPGLSLRDIPTKFQ